MGKGESEMKNWGLGGIGVGVVSGVLGLGLASFALYTSIKTEDGELTLKENEDLKGFAAFMIAFYIIVIVVTVIAFRRLRIAHNLYLKVSSETGAGHIPLVTPAPAPVATVPAPVAPTPVAPAPVAAPAAAPSLFP